MNQSEIAAPPGCDAIASRVLIKNASVTRLNQGAIRQIFVEKHQDRRCATFA